MIGSRTLFWNDISFCRFGIQADSLSGFHANTHIPVVIGGQMRYEVTGDLLYKVEVTRQI